MNKELTKKLYDKYPKIFVDKDKSPRESCMAFGIECGDGWYDIIDTMCEAFTYTYDTGLCLDEATAKEMGIEPDIDITNRPFYHLEVKSPQVVALQVKEKFGTLRFYYRFEFEPSFQKLANLENPPKEVGKIVEDYSGLFRGIVHMAETMSRRTCEVTGKAGEMHVAGGWYRTLNREFVKTDPVYSQRDYIAVADLPKE